MQLEPINTLRFNLSDVSDRFGGMHSVEELEGVALRVHGELDTERLDAFAIAAQLGVEVRIWAKSHGMRRGDTIFCPSPMKVRETRRQGILAHELGHWLLEAFGLDARCETSARYLAGALMLPRERFLRDMASAEYDLGQLLARYPNSSAEMIVVRMTQLSPATAWVWDHGRLARRYGLDEDDVSDYVDRVLTCEEPVIDGAIGAWPVFDGRWRRVIVLKKSA